MTLTEKWKKGELPSGQYWVMLDVSGDGKIMQTIISISNGKPVGWCKKSIKEVLAPVPSYEEWLENESHCAVYSDINKWLKQENQQLKALLKEWMHFYPIILYEHEDTLKTKDIIELYEKTREVLK
jgi:hypothetical protein